MTRLFGAHIIVGDETFRHVAERVRYRELGTPRLKGIKQRQTLYEILGHRDEVPVVSKG
jgi:class 3 adenylate cyclase